MRTHDACRTYRITLLDACRAYHFMLMVTLRYGFRSLWYFLFSWVFCLRASPAHAALIALRFLVSRFLGYVTLLVSRFLGNCLLFGCFVCDQYRRLPDVSLKANGYFLLWDSLFWSFLLCTCALIVGILISR